MVVGIKLLGAAFVVGAAAYYGIILSQTYDNRYWQLRHLYSIFLQMKSEMQYMNTPLPECFRILGDNAKEPVKAWLLGISDRLDNKEEVGFSIIWNEELDNLYNHSALTREDISLLQELADKLGTADGSTQGKAIDYTLLQLEHNRKDLESEMKEKKKVVTTISMFVGLVVLIILL